MASASPTRSVSPDPGTSVTVPSPRTPPGDAPARGEGSTVPVAGRVGEPDLLAVRLTHRLARRDAHRLATVADALASGTSRFSEKRAIAFGEWVERVCQESACVHDTEDAVLWPLLERHAGTGVDLAELRREHAVLHSLLGEVRRRSRAVVAALVLRPSPVATASDFAGMRELATILAELADRVSQHLTDTERVALGALVTHVPRTAWSAVRDELRACTPEPRLRAVAGPDEIAGLRASHGRVREARMRVAAARVRRLERLVYGIGDDADADAVADAGS